MSDIIFTFANLFNRIKFSIYVRFWNFYHLHQFKKIGCKIKNGKFRGRSFVDIHPTARVKIGENFACNSGPHICITTTTITKLLICKYSKFTVGINSGLSATSIICTMNVEIGNFVNIGAGTLIMDTNFHSTTWNIRSDREADEQNIVSAPVVIKDYVFIGARCILCKGVTIGERSIVAAGSVVIKNIPPDEIWGGNPAKFIKKID